MTVQYFGILLGLIAAWSLVIIATARWTISSSLKGIAARFEEQNRRIDLQDEKRQLQEKDTARELKIQGETQQKLTRESLELKADLPLCYVRREDFIRHEVTINTKLDRLRDLLVLVAPKREAGE